MLDDAIDCCEPELPDTRLFDDELVDRNAPLPPGIYVTREVSAWRDDSDEDGPSAVWVDVETSRVDVAFVRDRKLRLRQPVRSALLIRGQRRPRASRLRRRIRRSARGSPGRSADDDPDPAVALAGVAA